MPLKFTLRLLMIICSLGKASSLRSLPLFSRPITRGVPVPMSSSSTEILSTSVNGVQSRSHRFQVPLDHSSPESGEVISIFVREVVLEKDYKKRGEMPVILYLQGGPGFPAARPTFPLSGWMKEAVKEFRILLVDQRGTGQSTPITPVSLARRFPGEGVDAVTRKADFMTYFRADSIVRDCEVVRKNLCRLDGQVDGGAKKITLLGQSFGGFCVLTYLSLFPESLERCLMTVGLAPILRSADDV